jgi:exopolyphosphatase/guanosine-5'-triphosphate,3'-diphosphate pyrophosphatase
MKAAILDLGTNVYNLLIAEIQKNSCIIQKVVKEPSFTGAGGFSNPSISPEAAENSLYAIKRIMREIEKEKGVEIVKAFATSVFRDASNGRDFADEIKKVSGIDVEIITGEREAELIYKGVRESILIYDEKVLICDIGGGSNELIIAGKNDIYWLKSFNLGVVRLREMFNKTDPIGPGEVSALQQYLRKELKPLTEACLKYHPRLMIGTSGSFDTLRDILCPDNDGALPAMELEIPALKKLHEKLLASTREERMKIHGMSPFRVDYIVTGSIFIQEVIKCCSITGLWQSAYSLKEGYMAELAANER